MPSLHYLIVPLLFKLPYIVYLTPIYCTLFYYNSSLLQFDYKSISICKLQRHIDLDSVAIHLEDTCPILACARFTLHQLFLVI